MAQGVCRTWEGRPHATAKRPFAAGASIAIGVRRTIIEDRTAALAYDLERLAAKSLFMCGADRKLVELLEWQAQFEG